MPVLVYSITGSATWTALVAVAEGLPYLLTGLWAGALADHVDRRRVMVVADIAAAAVLATVPIAWWLGSLTAAHVLIAAFVVQTVFVFFDAANHGALPSLVSRERLPSANSLVFGGGTIVDTIVPGLAGLLMVVVAPASLVAVDAVTFLASALLVRAITRPLSGARQGGRPMRFAAVAEGVRFIVHHPILRIMTSIGALQAFSGGAFIALLVVWADRTLGIREGDWRLGLLFGAWGAGAVVGSTLMPRMITRFGAVRTELIFLPLSAAGGMITALTTSWIPALVAIAVWGVMYMGVASTSLTLRQLVTPERLMSRVMVAGRMVSFGAGYPLGAFLAGYLAERVGPSTALLICESALALGAAAVWLSPMRRAPKILTVAGEPAA